MAVYLHDIPLPVALERLDAALEAAGRGGILGVEEIPLDEQAVGRVLAEAVWAKISSPHYHASAMDGFAVRAAESVGAMPSTPLLLRYGTQTSYVDTGDPLPDWADAVIPIENTETLDEMEQPASQPRKPTMIRIRGAVTPWSHVRPLGEDMVTTQLVLPAGQVLRPVDLGAMAASGHSRARVARRPRVAILPTGSELVPIGKPPERGEIIEFNSVVLAAQVKEWGGEVKRFPILPDRLEAIREEVQEAAEGYDLILLNAGSSAGSEDFSAQVVMETGELLVHGVAVRPGHPVILGMVKRAAGGGVPVIGVPGYPVSAAMTAEIFIEPLISRWLGKAPREPVTVTAQLTRKVTSPGGDDDYMRVAVGKVGDRLLAAPLSRGAGVISSLVRADGIVVMPRSAQGAAAGTPVKVQLYRTEAEIERTLFAIGSHDITLDILAQYMAEHNCRLVSANVGSLAGLMALRRGEAHLAGSHLLDPETGVYNLSYIRQYLPGMAVKVVRLAGRMQGWLVKRGNPKGILGLSDLTRPEIRFVNRQRGSGTRLLLDYELGKAGIQAGSIQGYAQEEYTHLAVAAAVSSSRADCGLGIAAAAQALELDFIPLAEEQYELVIPAQYFESEMISALLTILKTPAFRRAVEALPGYNISQMGNLEAELSGL